MSVGLSVIDPLPCPIICLICFSFFHIFALGNLNSNFYHEIKIILLLEGNLLWDNAHLFHLCFFVRGWMQQQTGRSILVLMEESAYWFPCLFFCFKCHCWFFLLYIWQFRRYYYNKVSKESKWSIPEELKVSTIEKNFILNILSFIFCLLFFNLHFFSANFMLQVGPWASWKGNCQWNMSWSFTEFSYSTLCNSFCHWNGTKCR